mmetsp:Transcript_31839/g.73894  ORF Transcript_31839/g.73894 Transcript_31839/m.73894 type:complete len:237 (-) Transcript_31839:357-1067(-)
MACRLHGARSASRTTARATSPRWLSAPPSPPRRPNTMLTPPVRSAQRAAKSGTRRLQPRRALASRRTARRLKAILWGRAVPLHRSTGWCLCTTSCPRCARSKNSAFRCCRPRPQHASSLKSKFQLPAGRSAASQCRPQRARRGRRPLPGVQRPCPKSKRATLSASSSPKTGGRKRRSRMAPCRTCRRKVATRISFPCSSRRSPSITSLSWRNCARSRRRRSHCCFSMRPCFPRTLR